MREQREIVEKILGCVNGKPISFMQLCRQSGYNYRTVRRYLQLIEFLQDDENKIKVTRDGFRVVIRRFE